MIYRLHKNIFNWVASAKFLIGMFVGFAGYAVRINDFFDVCRKAAVTVNFVEPYIYCADDKWAVTVSIAGLIFAMSDMPYITQFEANAIYRTGKKKWLCEKYIYILICVFIYSLFILLFAVLMSAPVSYVNNSWSNLFKFAGTVGTGKIFFNGGIIISGLQPISAAAICLLLNLMYFLMLMSLMFSLSLYMRINVSCAVIVLFQATQHFLLNSRNEIFFRLFSKTFIESYQDYNFDFYMHLGSELVVILTSVIIAVLACQKIRFDGGKP